MNISCFVINLKSKPERWERMKLILGEYSDLTPIRIDAVQGSDIFPSNNYLPFSNEMIRSMTPGEMGCLLSHRKAWDLVSKAETEFSLVLEDDAVLSKRLKFFLKNFGLKQDAVDLIHLDPIGKGQSFYTSKNECIIHAGEKICRLYSSTFGTTGLLVSKQGAKKLLALSKNCVMPADELIFNKYSPSYGRIKVFQLESPLVFPLDVVLSTVPVELESSISKELKQTKTRFAPYFRVVKIIKKIRYLISLLMLNNRIKVNQDLSELIEIKEIK